MKRVFICFISLILIIIQAVPCLATDNKISVTINNKEITFDQKPIIKNGRTLVPIRPVCETLGADVYWNNEAQVVVIVRNKTKILLKIGETDFVIMNTTQDKKTLNDLIDSKTSNQIEEKELDCVPEIISGRTMLPIRAVCEALNADVKWNGNDNSITIKATNIKKNTNKTFYEEFIATYKKEQLSFLTSQKWHCPCWLKKEYGNDKLYKLQHSVANEGGMFEVYNSSSTTLDYYFSDDYTYKCIANGNDSTTYSGTYELNGDTLRLYDASGECAAYNVYSYNSIQNVFISKGTVWLDPFGDTLGDNYLIPYENMVTPTEAVDLLKMHLTNVYCFRFWDSFDDEFYYIQHYEDMDTHTATEGWYYVNKWTKEVIRDRPE